MRGTVTQSCTSGSEAKSFGSILREARESRGVSLDDAARVTRIGKVYLEALEQGMLHRLPDGVYAKGFLRSYATFLGLPEKEILCLFERETSPASSGETDLGAAGHPSATRRRGTFSSSRNILLTSLSLSVAAVAAVLLLKTPKVKEINEPPSPVVPQVNGQLQPPASNDTAKDVNAIPAGTDQDPAGIEQVPPPVIEGSQPTGLVLKIKVIEDGWLDITIDEAISQHYDLKAGDLIEWKCEKGFTLDIGNSGGIEADLNGRRLKPFGERGEVTHVVLKAGEQHR